MPPCYCRQPINPRCYLFLDVLINYEWKWLNKRITQFLWNENCHRSDKMIYEHFRWVQKLVGTFFGKKICPRAGIEPTHGGVKIAFQRHRDLNFKETFLAWINDRVMNFLRKSYGVNRTNEDISGITWLTVIFLHTDIVLFIFDIRIAALRAVFFIVYFFMVLTHLF